ncbi:hypothetical protein ACTHOQ_09145 [Solibacillus silvestris]|uniref:hypothetical protein n=1 Tax=Solibacillus silvestris TaxID=76853 RepID=UPI003F7EC6F0
MNITQKLYNSSNQFKIHFVTTYEQAAFLARNEPYLTFETAEQNFLVPNANLTIGERIEIDDSVYYAMEIHATGSKSEWQDIPQSFTKLVILLEEQPLMTMNIGQIAFDGDAGLTIDEIPSEKLQQAAQLLHDSQK